MRLSNIAQCLETSLTRQLFYKAKGLTDVIDLTLGDPDLKPAQCIRDAACAAIQEGKTRYSVNAGLIDAREAIAKCFSSETGVFIDPNSEIMLTIGGMGALYLSLAALINPGDEVLIIAPYYVNYVQMVHMCGGVPVIVYTDAKNGFKININSLMEKVSEKTRVLMINSPCNPTGVVIDGTTLDQIAGFCIENDICVISDEVYKSLIYTDIPYESIITRPGMKERTVLVDSMSKRFAMTGYRCGFAIGPADVIAAMTKMQENTASCTPLPSQYASIEAYSHCSADQWIRDEFKRRRDYIWKAINEIPMISCSEPEATFYLFVDISETGMDSTSFAFTLLEAEQVAVVPGVTYGTPYSDHIRISYTMPIDKLQTAVNRISHFTRSITKE